MPKLKPGTIVPGNDEDVRINAGIAADPDNPELTSQDVRWMRPAADVLPGLVGQEAADRLLKRRGRPAGSGKKEQLTVRFDSDVIEAFRAEGEGWQTRMNNALREWLAEHKASNRGQ